MAAASTEHSPLLLVCAGGLGREVAEAVQVAGRDVLGFLDDDPARRGTSVHGLPVLGGVCDAGRTPGAQLVLCAGDGGAREDLARRLARAGLTDRSYATVIHPAASVPPSCHVGAGSVLLAGTVLTADVRVGRHVVCMPRVVLTHDDVVEDFATLCAGAVLGGSVRVGRGALLGMSSSVRPGVTIGRAAVLGMGAVALTDVPAAEAWAGVPARPLRGDARSGSRAAVALAVADRA